MYQRAKILQAFEDAGLTRSQNAKVKQFLQYLENNPKACWSDAVQEFRDKYMEIQDDIVPAILETNDPLIVSNLLKYANLKNDSELKNVKKHIRKTSAFKQPRLFLHLAKHYHAELGGEIKSKAALPGKIHTILNIQLRKKQQAAEEVKSGELEVFSGKNRQHYFHLKSDRGDILLVSEGYKSRAGCINGVKSVKSNGPSDGNYLRKTSKDGQFYYLLVAKNKKVIGTGTMCATEQIRDKRIEEVQKIISDAKIVT